MSQSSRPADPDDLAKSVADPFGLMQQMSAASTDVMQAWTQAWGSILNTRGAPVAETAMKVMANPLAWPTALVPMLDEIRAALKLPRFADLPGLDLAHLPSPAPLLGLMQVAQDYAAVSVPVWIKACERFQAEVRNRQQAAGGEGAGAGELMDVWNNVLDRTLMEFNRSGEFAKAQQRLLHAAAQQRREFSASVERVAKAVDMPTRTEMTDVYARLHALTREVYALRREVRALKRAARPSRDEASETPAGTNPEHQ